MHPSGYKISAGFQSRQVTFAGCNQSEANVRKISDTAALSQNVRNFPDAICQYFYLLLTYMEKPISESSKKP